MKKTTLRGVATISFWADDVEVAKKWYAEFLDVEPYFQREYNGKLAYVEFRLGDYQQELGIISSQFKPKMANATIGGAVLYWHVENLATTIDKLKRMGATEYEPVTPRGEGFITASLVDPFGNILGIMYNPHYVEMLFDKLEAQN